MIQQPQHNPIDPLNKNITLKLTKPLGPQPHLNRSPILILIDQLINNIPNTSLNNGLLDILVDTGTFY